MIGKTDWKKYIHDIRDEEISIISRALSARKFRSGIEFGAGDGYQTASLSKWCDSFTSTDLNFARIKEELKVPGVEYMKCDADSIGNALGERKFDLIFSSNLIEHLSNRSGFLRDTLMLMGDDGLAVHVVPGRGVKIAYMLLFHVNSAMLVFDRLIGLFKGKKMFRGAGISLENNINSNFSKKRSWLRMLFVPGIHGNYETHMEEIRAWSKKRWQILFENMGYELVGYSKGPVFSGYGFGCSAVRNILRKLGVSSEHVFILRKKTTG